VWMSSRVRRALTRVEYRSVGSGGKKLRRVEIPPPERLVYGLCFSFVALVCLVLLEALHIVFLGSFSNEVFAAITGVIGTISGVFLTSG